MWSRRRAANHGAARPFPGASIQGTLTGPETGESHLAMIDAAPPREAELFGHPRGLTYLFGTEMWERFSYYGMRVLLPIYLTGYLLLPGHAQHVIGFQTMKGVFEWMRGPLNAQQLQSMIYMWYTGFVYFTPLVGGYLADRWFGRRYTVVVGGLLMAVGHFLMAFDSYFYFALLFLILGNGGFKPNISTQVGGLYRPGDHRIDRAYSIFYVGINTGAALGQILCGMLGEKVGWHYGFAAAGIGMLIGTIIYLFALRTLPRDVPTTTAPKTPTVRKPFNATDWRAFAILILLFVPCCLFWATYEQSGNVIETWSRDNVDRLVALGSWSFTIPVSTIQSFNPIFIMAFTPLVVTLWRWQEKRGAEPSVITKMVIGCVLVTLSYLLLASVQYIAGPLGKVHWIWSIVYFVILTMGELYFSPVGLSLYARAAPAQIGAFMMAVFLATSFPGNLLAGWIGTYWSVMDKTQFFLMIAAIIGMATPVIWVFDGAIRRIMRMQVDDRSMLSEAPYLTPIE
jgi:proton-dependent oligopeptide transporter, POT family